MKVIAFIEDHQVIDKIIRHLVNTITIRTANVRANGRMLTMKKHSDPTRFARISNLFFI